MTRYDVIFTLDYEIHGGGWGSPRALMVEPTARMLRQFDRHGAKLTIMADAAEILRFRRHTAETGRDDFHLGEIEEQLTTAIRTGHDVQLHLHPSWFNATLAGGRWQQDYDEYDIASLPYERIDEMLLVGKRYLEDLLHAADPSYRCVVFRAANWSMQPSGELVRALVRNGLEIDTSVFKHGRRSDIVRFDYENAHSALVPWRVDAADICRHDPRGSLLEVPIYSESRRIHHFISVNRLYRVAQSRLYGPPDVAPRDTAAAAMADVDAPSSARRAVRLLISRHAWKLDFNQASGRQLIAGLERAAQRHDGLGRALPVVLIGHSKTYTRLNERLLEPFLAHVGAAPSRFRFATFREAGDWDCGWSPGA